MHINIKTIEKTLSLAQLKQNINDNVLTNFHTNLNKMLNGYNENETEEHNKSILSDFLKDSFYKEKYVVNTKEKIDLAIYKGMSSSDNVSVIIEVKSPKASDMITKDKYNKKSLHELILYFMRESLKHKNTSITHLIATNLKSWFIFEAKDFYNQFYTNNEFRKIFKEWEGESGLFDYDINNDYRYKKIKEFLDEHPIHFDCCYFDIFDFKNLEQGDNKLINLAKIISPEHLLKKSFTNDSNSLNNDFYNELLYILGLEETASKKIERRKENDRNSGSVIENTISVLKNKNKHGDLKINPEGNNISEEDLFSWSLELCIIWLNRILFLKLLEGQLIIYHNGKREYSFLNNEKINDYDELHELFFEVLSEKEHDRIDDIKIKYPNIPYLNSSLFDKSIIERQTFTIESLKDRYEIPLYSNTVLKNSQGKKETKPLKTLDYLFRFLDSYNFASDSAGIVQKDNKQIINAAVLGLIFEKINGYQDGSHFTPSFITMYMCRDSIRKAVVNKFNTEMNWKCKDFDILKEYIEYKDPEIRIKSNKIINSLKICDPAVGSGHFLVSALNEIISIKHDLKILNYLDGSRIRDYSILIENDELIIVEDETDEIFSYKMNQNGKPIEQLQKLQMALFHEKLTIIENCLFGVDINQKSVMICQLRLWIELLKNAYYKAPDYTELETLPNIDINIKCGNSLINRFSLDNQSSKSIADAKIIPFYKDSVAKYKNIDNSKEKNKLKIIIENYRMQLKGLMLSRSSNEQQLIDNKEKLRELLTQGEIFEAQKSNAAQKEYSKKVEYLTTQINILEAEIENMKSNPIYKNAIEWLYDFPEVLDDEGNFLGFDIVIGNPPYFSISTLNNEIKELYEKQNYQVFSKTTDIYSLFIEKGLSIITKTGYLSFITSNKWMRAGYGELLREYLSNKITPLKLIDFSGLKVFDSSTVDTNILFCTHYQTADVPFYACTIYKDFKKNSSIEDYFEKHKLLMPKISKESWLISSEIENKIKEKIERIGTPLKEWDIKIYRGILTGFNEAFIIDNKKRDELIKQDPKNEEIIKQFIRGRDINNSKFNYNSSFLINSHNGIKEQNIPRINVPQDYPAIYKHLHQYENELINRQDKGDHWTNLRNCAYLDEFEKDKIAFPVINRKWSFIYIEPGIQVLAPMRFITANTKSELFYIKSVFGGTLIKWYWKRVGNMQDDTGYQMDSYIVEQIPIPKISLEKQQPFIDLVDIILAKKEIGEDTTAEERKIDMLVYELYELTDEEIRVVDGN